MTIDSLSRDHKRSSSLIDDSGRHLHVLTLTPFFPSAKNEVRGCFIREPIDHLTHLGVTSTVFAVQPLYYPRATPSHYAPARWISYPQLPGNLGLSSAGWFLYTYVARRVMQLHHQSPIDLIHAHGALPCGRAAASLSRRLKIPFVTTVHGLDVFNAHRGRGPSARWRRRRSIEVYETARVVICISGRVQQMLKAAMPEVRSTVVYNGSDADLFSPNPDPQNDSEQLLLAVGDFIPTKGQELVLRAIALLAPSLPQLRVQFIGEGPDESRLRLLSTELGIAERVEFLGRRSRAEVAGAMRKCSVFVLPSRSEGLGCVYLEAMACGKPVIACRGQGIEEIIEHGKNGWLIAPDNLDELVRALSTLLQSRDISASMGSAARETILKNLTLSHQARALLEVYREVIAHR